MKKSLSILLVLTLIIFLMAGCGSKKETKKENSNSTQKTKTTKDNAKKSSSKPEVVTIKAQTKGAEMTRVDNLVEAAKKLNDELKQQGKNIQVKVEASAFDGSWDDYRKKFILGYQSNKEPDIYVAGHEDIAWLAKGKYIMALDQLKDSKAYSDVYETLWESVKWNGHIWGAIQDTEVRPIFFNVKVLKKLGWTDEQIKALPDKVIKGEFTLDDMTAVAKQAKDKGLVQWGILHRPTNGPEFHMIAKDFGAQIYDAKQDKIVFDKANILKALKYFKELTVDKKITPDTITAMEWKNVHQLMIDGKCLFWYGGIWNIFNYVAQGADYDKMMDQFDFMLVPAAKKGGKPLTLSHPMIYTVSSQTKHPDLVVRLLEIVAAPEYQVKHAIKTCHLPINKRSVADEKFKNDKFLTSVTYMLDYTIFLPNNENFKKYSDVYYKAIQSVELGKYTPQQAIDYMEKELKNSMKDDIIIK